MKFCCFDDRRRFIRNIDEDHGYIAGTAIQTVQKPIESTGRFYGKLHSRSFPELSDAKREKPPVRQNSDNQASTIKHEQMKLPVASTKFPAVETGVKSNNSYVSNQNPYSFDPVFKNKGNYSDEVFGESTGSTKIQTIHIDSRPRTHPPTNNNQQYPYKNKRPVVEQLESNQRKSRQTMDMNNKLENLSWSVKVKNSSMSHKYNRLVEI
ncbi:CLUMA_CG016016, isoform A [Clunio marinus]|uniref:CLUMA_CG016016, isoform A n=1 Tax=Clunio marinus TaxID=568069 RepID=A0A1J1IRC5_9DIPT|nr:CLUMA_CG016016, isoform A [Clunio marinus]